MNAVRNLNFSHSSDTCKRDVELKHVTLHQTDMLKIVLKG